MTRLTAMIIATNGEDIKCSAGGPSKTNGNYVGWIEHWRDGRLHQPLLNSEPVFKSAEKAVEAMKEIVQEVREWWSKENEQTKSPTVACGVRKEGDK